jgi:hypothetical protein
MLVDIVVGFDLAISGERLLCCGCLSQLCALVCNQGPHEEEIIEAVSHCLWSTDADVLGDEFQESIESIRAAVAAQHRLRAEHFHSSETVITGYLSAGTPIPGGGTPFFPASVSLAPTAATTAAVTAANAAAVYGLNARVTAALLGVDGTLTSATYAGWATDSDAQSRAHHDVVAARRATIVDMLLQLQRRLPRCLHVGHVLLGLSRLVTGASGSTSAWVDGAMSTGRRRTRNCIDAVLDLISISSLVNARPMLAEGCYNILFSIAQDSRLSHHVLDVAQVCERRRPKSRACRRFCRVCTVAASRCAE